VILLSRNSSDTGLRIFNSIQRHGLDIRRAAFTSGAPTWPYATSFGADLFLSANPDSVRRALEAGVAAATILPSPAPAHRQEQLRIAFDGDAVIFGDESERVSREQGVEAFGRHERERAREPLSGGPFRNFLDALHRLQAAFPAGDAAPIRTALVTARSAPAHERVIRTLREWGVRLDEALFLGGRDKGPFLEAFGADIFFDDSEHNIASARDHVAAGHVPHGVANPQG
jgi:5'-nucleotidase